jgi:hypothetical protein
LAVNVGLATKQNQYKSYITGTGTTNFFCQSLREQVVAIGNSILSESGGILNVSGSGVFSSSGTANNDISLIYQIQLPQRVYR